MARTIYGNHTGNAAREQINDEVEYGRDLYWKERDIFWEKYVGALDLLKELDPQGWEDWYDHAPGTNPLTMYPLIKTRCRELLKAETREEKTRRLLWREYWNGLIDALEAEDPHGWRQWYDYTWKEKGVRTKLEMLPYVLEKLTP